METVFSTDSATKKKKSTYLSRWRRTKAVHLANVKKFDAVLTEASKEYENGIPIPSRSDYRSSFTELVEAYASGGATPDDETLRASMKLRVLNSTINDGAIEILSPESVALLHRWRVDRAVSKVTLQGKLVNYSLMAVRNVAMLAAVLPLIPGLEYIGLSRFQVNNLTPILKNIYSSLNGVRYPLTFTVFSTFSRSNTGVAAGILKNPYIMRCFVFAVYGAIPGSLLTGTVTSIIGIVIQQIAVQKLNNFGEYIDKLDISSHLTSEELTKQLYMAALAEKSRQISYMQAMKSGRYNGKPSVWKTALFPAAGLSSLYSLYRLARYLEWGLPPPKDRLSNLFIKEAPWLQRTLFNALAGNLMKDTRFGDALSKGLGFIWPILFGLISYGQYEIEYKLIYPTIQSFYTRLGLDKKVKMGLNRVLGDTEIPGRLAVEKAFSTWFKTQVILDFTVATIASNAVHSLSIALPIAAYGKLIPSQWLVNMVSSHSIPFMAEALVGGDFNKAWTSIFGASFGEYSSALAKGDLNRVKSMLNSEGNVLIPPGTPLYAGPNRVEAYVLASNADGMVLIQPNDLVGKELNDVKLLKEAEAVLSKGYVDEALDLVLNRERINMKFLSYESIASRFGSLKTADGKTFNPAAVAMFNALEENQKTLYSTVSKSGANWDKFKDYNENYLKQKRVYESSMSIHKRNMRYQIEYDVSIQAQTGLEHPEHKAYDYLKKASGSSLLSFADSIIRDSSEDVKSYKNDKRWYTSFTELLGSDKLERARTSVIEAYTKLDKGYEASAKKIKGDVDKLNADRAVLLGMNNTRTEILESLATNPGRAIVLPAMTTITEISSVKNIVIANHIAPTQKEESSMSNRQDLSTSSTLAVDITIMQAIANVFDLSEDQVLDITTKLGDPLIESLSNWGSTVSRALQRVTADGSGGVYSTPEALVEVEANDPSAKCFSDNYERLPNGDLPVGYESCFGTPLLVKIYGALTGGSNGGPLNMILKKALKFIPGVGVALTALTTFGESVIMGALSSAKAVNEADSIIYQLAHFMQMVMCSSSYGAVMYVLCAGFNLTKTPSEKMSALYSYKKLTGPDAIASLPLIAKLASDPIGFLQTTKIEDIGSNPVLKGLVMGTFDESPIRRYWDTYLDSRNSEEIWMAFRSIFLFGIGNSKN